MKPLLLLQICALVLTACGPMVASAEEADPVPHSFDSLPDNPATLPASPTQISAPLLLAPQPLPANRPLDGVLDAEQQERVYQASLGYIADTEEEAIRIARGMDFIINDGYPSNMCGPLALAILQDAGLISPYIDLHRFWLLQPDVNRQVILGAFPTDRFDHFRSDRSLNEFDFQSFPLKVGDVMYLYAGIHGTFEHILTVTRIDHEGRAFSVTNLNSEVGFVIREVMLYDPQQPGVGQFFEWTDRRNGQIGTTGFGGFELWRFAQPVPESTATELTFAGNIDQIFGQVGGEWYAIIQDNDSGRRIYDRNSNETIQVAAFIKIPVAMLFFTALEQQGISESALVSYIQRTGIGRTYAQLLEQLLVYSEEEATSTLLSYIRRSGVNERSLLSQWGVGRINLDLRTAPLEEIAELLNGLHRCEWLSPTACRYILDLLAEYTANDATRLGILREVIPNGGTIYNMRGTITDEFLAIGDAGLVIWPYPGGFKSYSIVIFGYGGRSYTNDILLTKGIEEAAALFWGLFLLRPREDSGTRITWLANPFSFNHFP
ncbi:MAG: serine hydrolase [Chloroflexota bacterium]